VGIVFAVSEALLDRASSTADCLIAAVLTQELNFLSLGLPLR
jgi:hypothetical protein